MAQRRGERAELDLDDDTPVFVISVAAQLAGMHPQTLRQYDRIGLVSPDRTRGRGRRYSARDVATLREVQRLSQDGVSLAGIKRILELETHVNALQARVLELSAELERAQASAGLSRRVFAAGPGGEVVSLLAGRRPDRSAFGPTSALVVWRPRG
ncbi:heat shock protein transcriptional repressor HspR [Angustibacter sp. Root456]|uniref:heat shock protein transcriptional repressor HspR n=1 Tax=Angustibacter sp. Root456 TaxID=1736539 RepID=UPI0006FD5F9F|nr:helix-turn-helix transcriptional regulator [Angustibacter sp. Root456]KQX62025.1 heat-shock protein [Angustibacter sp. Root456]